MGTQAVRRGPRVDFAHEPALKDGDVARQVRRRNGHLATDKFLKQA